MAPTPKAAGKPLETPKGLGYQRFGPDFWGGMKTFAWSQAPPPSTAEKARLINQGAASCSAAQACSWALLKRKGPENEPFGKGLV